MIENSKLAIIALVAAVGIASPALAQRARHAPTNQTWIGLPQGAVNSDSPALTGGGTLGFNERAHYSSQ